MRTHGERGRSARGGFTVTELLIASGLSVLLGVILGNLYAGLCVPARDAARRCRIATKASLAVSALAQDLGGNLVDAHVNPWPTGTPPEGPGAWRFIFWDASVPGSLSICFRAESNADNATILETGDVIVNYSLQGVNGDQLVRTNSATGSTVTVADGLVPVTVAGTPGFLAVAENPWLSITLVFAAKGIAPEATNNEFNQLTYNVVALSP